MSADLPQPEGEPALPSDWVAWIDADADADSGTAREAASDGVGPDRSGPNGAWSGALERARAQAKVLRSLRRLAAPAAMDGAVVAALHAGHTEDRARGQVEALRPLNAPPELDELVARSIEREVEASPSGIVAPPQLDGLVERMVSAELDAPVAAPATAGGPDPSLRPVAGPDSSRSQRSAMWASMAAAAVLVLGSYLLTRTGTTQTGTTRTGTIQTGTGGNVDGDIPTVASFIELVPVTADDLSPADRSALFQFGAQLRGGRS